MSKKSNLLIKGFDKQCFWHNVQCVTVKNEDLSRKKKSIWKLGIRNPLNNVSILGDILFLSRDIGSKIVNERNSKQILGDKSKFYASNAFKTTCCDF